VADRLLMQLVPDETITQPNVDLAASTADRPRAICLRVRTGGRAGVTSGENPSHCAGEASFRCIEYPVQDLRR
jgi:hypothetical protein